MHKASAKTQGVDQRLVAGHQAESAACELLRDVGLAIIERNYRCKLGELDIIATQDDLLVFVEVRSRSSNSFGGATVSATKRRQVSRVAAAYLTNRRPIHRRTRFDVVIVTAGIPTHIPDAWRLGLA
jgi:putative endonuclease